MSRTTRRVAVIAIFVAIVTGVSATAPFVPGVEAAATVCVRISYARFDASGDDNVMPGLNDEYVTLKNLCGVSQALGGWTLADRGTVHRYTFPSGVRLGARASITVRSGRGTNTSSTLYWGRASGQVWDNTSTERAYVRNASGYAVANFSPYLDRTLVGAGDIASCGRSGDEATARLLDTVTGTVFTTGDNVYERGTSTEFSNCYAPSWGRHRARTRPAVGNHEYYDPAGGAAGYFGYFGSNAGTPGKGYYSYGRGPWHIVVLNSNCSYVGGCGPGSPQEQWLRADLASHPADCTLAYWHHPRFSSGAHGGSSTYAAFWQALDDYGADVVVVGHDHLYERFAPQTAAGVPHPTGGIRQFVVGTGGRSLYPFGTPVPNSEVRYNGSAGVLKLALWTDSFSWRFIPVAGHTFSDSGTQSCN